MNDTDFMSILEYVGDDLIEEAEKEPSVIARRVKNFAKLSALLAATLVISIVFGVFAILSLDLPPYNEPSHQQNNLPSAPNEDNNEALPKPGYPADEDNDNSYYDTPLEPPDQESEYSQYIYKQDSKTFLDISPVGESIEIKDEHLRYLPYIRDRLVDSALDKLASMLDADSEIVMTVNDEGYLCLTLAPLPPTSSEEPSVKAVSFPITDRALN